jgi:hypothetical protein
VGRLVGLDFATDDRTMLVWARGGATSVCCTLAAYKHHEYPVMTPMGEGTKSSALVRCNDPCVAATTSGPVQLDEISCGWEYPVIQYGFQHVHKTRHGILAAGTTSRIAGP